ncbi:hypothetical protein SAMN04488503_2929 [Humidesulfovibrio mexicanus]|jgi:hypothetical protein|uniref:Uncharacterized protein n=1 Tax=Humidesulfovibrio mexicanus TaxID=147047 RepID=A0A239C478_9BACT|nr:hypothetical protein [Humidesulfovibrio mexicanus]SNS14712.1 hypothetical protein SAMN04488503_2929 [Humidesulfovibrio mexicanus]
MFTKAGLLIALALVFFGYRWGKRKALERLAPPQARAAAAPPPDAAQPKAAGWLSVKLLLGVVIVLLIIAIFTSLQR